MATFLDDDIVRLTRADGSSRQYYWGDRVEKLASDSTDHDIRVLDRKGRKLDEGRVAKKAKFRTKALLRLSMIDVQQGDGLILETPADEVVFIDGGDNQLFARHAAARFRGTTATDPLIVDLMLVTHGDADHFAGLSEVLKSETNASPRKRLFVAPKRYFHNGIVKRPSSRPDSQLLGPTSVVAGATFVTGLVDDPASLPPGERNQPFNEWVTTLAAWDQRTEALTGQPIERRRIDHQATSAFDFLKAGGVRIDLLGPIVEDANGAPGLRFLREPPDDAELMLGTGPASAGNSAGSGLTASHTINGHSIAFRLQYGNVRFLFTGDLNQEAGQRLREAMPGTSLRCEVLKAPHHGSADFDMELLKEAGPVVSMISSGDENAQKEYIHPRATLMAALGRASRTTPAILFVTELAAFFTTKGYVTPKKGKPFFAFERTNFGIIHIRTDGERVLAFTHSGKAGMNEAYRFTVSSTGEVVFAAKIRKV